MELPWSAPMRVDENTFEWQVAEGWQQGRGAYGGLVLATMASAMETALGDAERVLRALTGSIGGPVMVGGAVIRVEMFRSGSALTTVSARLEQGDAVLAQTTGIFAKKRVSDREWTDLRTPEMPLIENASVAPVEPPIGPVFAQNFEFRPTGDLPFSGGSRAAAEGWILSKHLRDQRAPWTPAALIAHVDSYWPAAFAKEEGPRPMSTVAFTFELCADPREIEIGVPLFYRAMTPSSHDGFCVEFRELWDRSGKLVALNQQTFVFVK